VVVVALAASVIVAAAGSDPAPASPAGASSETEGTPAAECRGIDIEATGSWRTKIRRAGPGATFCFGPGIFRLRKAIITRDRQTFIGQPGTILNGARVLHSFEPVAGGWAIHDQTQQEKTRGECRPASYTACRFPEQVFVDDRPLRQVAVPENLRTGTFFFDYGADSILLADDPAGHKVEVSVANAAFEGYSQNVTITGFVVEKFANGAGTGAISASDRRWSVLNNEVRFNHGAGIQVSRGRVIGNWVHHNGQIGIVGPYAKKLLVAGNEIDHNNTAGFDYAWEAGGTKWVHSTDLVVRGNHSHDNLGNGLWTDWNNLRTVYRNNVVEGNSAAGIFHESSYDATISNNISRNNGHGDLAWDFDGAGIKVMSSSDVNITDNTVIDNAAGIILLQVERPTGPRGPFETRNVSVVGNQVHMLEGFSGLYQDAGDFAFAGPANNRFDRNSYYVSEPIARYFLWRSGERTWDEWRNDGHDAGGALLAHPGGVRGLRSEFVR
jgi:parallel beta-helix repeat protein